MKSFIKSRLNYIFLSHDINHLIFTLDTKFILNPKLGDNIMCNKLIHKYHSFSKKNLEDVYYFFNYNAT
jgi:hypothetical protein